MMSETEEDWTDPADAPEYDTAHEARALSLEDRNARSGAEMTHLDTKALELCIRADLWP
jgi:hypothetical protein